MTRSNNNSRRDSARVGETVDDEVAVPADLELQVKRRRRRVRSSRLWSGLVVAAAIVTTVGTVAVVRGASGGGGVRVTTSPTTAVVAHDALQPGTVMLAARGRYVVSLDARGHTNATMVAAQVGDITYARATDDHHALWYLSMKKGSNACGDVVRADIDGRTSKIVTHAVAFDVSPDGSRLALYGAGDLTADRCSPVGRGAGGRVVGRRPHRRDELDGPDRRRHRPALVTRRVVPRGRRLRRAEM